MKAAVIDRYGPPDVLVVRDIPVPTPGAHEILVRNHASIASPPDCAMRSANPFIIRFFSGLWRPKTPVIGYTVAGEVAAVGAGVTRFKPGDRIYGAADTRLGGYAEFALVVDDSALVPLPDGPSYGEAAAIAESFLTAWPFLREGAVLQPGQSILINGASGSIGGMAVQLAKHMGAVVTGVCSGRNADLVRSLGADHVIDYTKADFTAGGVAYDVIFDAIGKSSFARTKAALQPGGIYLTTVPSLGIMLQKGKADAQGRRANILFTGLRPESEKLTDLALVPQLLAAGAIRPVIDRTYPLSDIAEAHRYVETGRKTGSVVVEI